MTTPTLAQELKLKKGTSIGFSNMPVIEGKVPMKWNNDYRILCPVDTTALDNTNWFFLEEKQMYIIKSFDSTETV